MLVLLYILHHMLETPHVLVGAAIATAIPNPAISIPLALASHVLLDRIPHWNPHFYTETQKYGQPTPKSTAIAIVDSAAALTAGLFLAARFLPNYGGAISVIAACLASVLSDQIKMPYFFFKQRTGFFKFWTNLERSWQVEASFIPGIITQILISLAALWWILV